jgi:FAD:protein FMN transferase
MSMALTRTTTAWRWHATGTTWQIHHTGGVDAAMAQRAAAAVAEDEARWSRFLPDSVTSRITRGAGGPVSVDGPTLDLIEACLFWAAETDGVFQPLIGGAMSRWGYGRSIDRYACGVPDSPADSPVRGVPTLDRERSTVSIPAGTALDLGGIAKSWMARRIADRLLAWCEDPFLLVDAGGDLVAARGEHLVAVENPARPPAALATVILQDGHGVATSGYGRRRWVNGDGIKAHHLIDPHTGHPGPLTHATVVADDPVRADVLAKTLALRPLRIRELTDPALVIVDGRRRTTPRWIEVTR